MKITVIATHLSSSSASYLSMGFISETNFYFQKNELHAKWIHTKREDFIYFLQAGLGFIKKKIVLVSITSDALNLP